MLKTTSRDHRQGAPRVEFEVNHVRVDDLRIPLNLHGKASKLSPEHCQHGVRNIDADDPVSLFNQGNQNKPRATANVQNSTCSMTFSQIEMKRDVGIVRPQAR